jgi:RNA recognition motif-containing protein
VEAPAKPAAEAKVPNTIFVGGLPFTKTPDEIRDYFGGALYGLLRTCSPEL